MERLDLFKCEICGNIIEVLEAGGGGLVCCGQPMQELIAKHNEEAMEEKHVPVFVKKENGSNEVRVGEVLHPMNEDHHILFIQTISEDKKRAGIQFFSAGEQPVKESKEDETTAREYCNIHGLWEGKND